MSCIAHLEGSEGVARVLTIQLFIANLKHIQSLLSRQELLVLTVALLGDIRIVASAAAYRIPRFVHARTLVSVLWCYRHLSQA